MKPMTPNQIREFLPLFQAFADGKKVERFIVNDDPAFVGGGAWIEDQTPDFDPASRWRVKREPRLLYASFYKSDPGTLLRVSLETFPVSEGMELVTFKEVVE